MNEIKENKWKSRKLIVTGIIFCTGTAIFYHLPETKKNFMDWVYFALILSGLYSGANQIEKNGQSYIQKKFQGKEPDS